MPIEQVKQVIRMLPDSCKRCKRKFTEREKQAALQNNVHRHQVAEIPEMKAETTEYQFGSVVCCCGESAADSC